MPTNILAVIDPQHRQIPSPALRHAANTLLSTANQLQVGMPTSGNSTVFVRKAAALISSWHGNDQGPVRNAMQELPVLTGFAMAAGYDLSNNNVLGAFAQFVLAYVTAGFLGEDTTGTQAGERSHLVR